MLMRLALEGLSAREDTKQSTSANYQQKHPMTACTIRFLCQEISPTQGVSQGMEDQRDTEEERR